MVDIPTETLQELQSTITINEITSPTYIRISMFTPFPGAPLYEKRCNYESYFSSNYSQMIVSKEKRRVIAKWIEDLRKENRLWND